MSVAIDTLTIHELIENLGGKHGASIWITSIISVSITAQFTLELRDADLAFMIMIGFEYNWAQVGRYHI